MTFLNAYDDFMQSVGVFSNCFGKVEYLESLRGEDGALHHWGLEKVHGKAAAEAALQRATHAIAADVLRTPLQQLWREMDPQGTGKSVTRTVKEFTDWIEGWRLQPEQVSNHLRFIQEALTALAEEQ